MKAINNRLDKLESVTPNNNFDASILSESELKFMSDTLEKAGYKWNQEGDISVLNDHEIHRLETLIEKATK